MAKLFRHGDVLFKRIDTVPNEAEEKSKAATLVVAEGETTGHFHLLSSAYGGVIADRILKTGSADRRFITMDSDCKLTHQEHAELDLPAGSYEIIQEREWDYVEREKRKVVD